MLPKYSRLRAKEVAEVIARGKGKRGDFLSLKLANSDSPFRCAVVVSKKVSKSAVRRNKLRRAVYRALLATSLPSSGHAILFVQSSPMRISAASFIPDIKKLLHV